MYLNQRWVKAAIIALAVVGINVAFPQSELKDQLELFWLVYGIVPKEEQGCRQGCS